MGFWQVEGEAVQVRDGFLDDRAVAFEQASVSGKSRAHEFGQCHYEMTVRNGQENVVHSILVSERREREPSPGSSRGGTHLF